MAIKDRKSNIKDNKLTTATEADNTTTDSVGVAVPSYAWKSAYGVLVAMVVTIPLGIGFFMYSGVFGPLSDVGALLVGLLLAPLVWTIYLLHVDVDFNKTVFGVGVITVAGICIGSLGLVVASLFSLTETYGALFLGLQFLGWILLGAWLFGVGILGRRSGTVGNRTTWTAIVAGIGAAVGMLTLVYSYAVGSFTLLFPLFMFVFIVGFLLWAFLVGSELRAQYRMTDKTDPGI